jgi:putative ABC transport system substrate-binding protein
MQAAASLHGVTLAVRPVHSLSEIEQITADTGREPNGGLMVLTDTFMFGRRPGIIALAAEHHLPAIYPIRAFAVEGGLIAYGIDRIDPFHRAAAYVDRILRGTQPASLPVQQPTKFDLVINLKTAKTLGITVPSTLIARADEVIE